MPPTTPDLPTPAALPQDWLGAPWPAGRPSSRSESDPPLAALKEIVARSQREHRKIQELLSYLGFALRSLQNVNQFLELTPLIASRVTEADGAALLLFDNTGHVGTTSPPRLSLEQFHCHHNADCQVVRRALEAAIAQLGQSTDRLTAEVMDHQIQDSLGPEFEVYSSPIAGENRDLGRLYGLSRQPGFAWTEARRQLLGLVADQTAVAIEQNRLRLQLRQKERLDRELEIGAEIQRHLLPEACPAIPGVQLAARTCSARSVGGDYYDFIPVPGEDALVSWAIVIGDVMGKGVPAGMLMTMTRGILRVLRGQSPAHVLDRLNQVMYTDLENSHRFVTLFYSEYNPHTRQLRFSNAAHNPPLLWRPAVDRVERLDTCGALIGLEPAPQYEDATLNLEPGDTVLYYTDGFTEATNPRGERFEEEGLMTAFQEACHRNPNPQAIVQDLFTKAQTFTGAPSDTEDDRTLVVFQAQP
ncbi:MAG: PP2C family protein-serine/threonine phosphatase [Gloeomargaritaceae cyanobacterium C42_A2020_066]|nr:PP2C family protein-serine/threonine phosphatase [Gloeomargaritaceae cyanobacterium C42_A2020_066]